MKQRAALTRKDVSLAMATLMPQILRGVQLEFFVKQRVTQTQFLMLAAIRAYRRCSMGTLARSLHVSMPTATGIVDRLVRDGYLHRAPHPEDRRQVLVELAPKAERFVRDFQEVIRHRWEEALTTLTAEELRAFYEVITKLRERLEILPG